jgi:adenylosuccinate synthase
MVALSGPVAGGKSELADRLARTHGAFHVRTRQLMFDRAARIGESLSNERGALQRYGDQLDAKTNGRWVADELAGMLSSIEARQLIVIDSIRIPSQLSQLQAAFGRDIIHVHVTASLDTLAHRYASRKTSTSTAELHSYNDVRADPVEARVGELAADADIVIDTDRYTSDDVFASCVAQIGLRPPLTAPLVDVLIGGQYGSEGKGNVAYYLASEYDALVRVGGPNAGHKVPTPGQSYTHRLLPSGTRANEEALLVIGPGAVLDLDVLLQEIADCQVEASRLRVDPQAMVIEDADVVAETKLVDKIGSTGRGVGAATGRRILNRDRAREDLQPVRLARDLKVLDPYLEPTSDVLARLYSRRAKILLEGTQGTSLSLYHGQYPHVTSRDTTASGCLAEAGIGPTLVRKVIGVFRTYPIRVSNGADGSSGGMAQEIDFEVVAQRSGIEANELIETEKGSVSKKKRRVGEFEWAQLCRSTQLNSLTDIALTFADYVDIKNRDARRFDQLTPKTLEFISQIERVAGVPVSLIATRFEVRSIIDRRQW